MRTILLTVIMLFLFTGCYNKQPKVEIVKVHETKIILPDENNYTFFSTPTLPEDLSTLTQEEIVNAILTYSLKLQTTVQLYEQRTKSLIQWRDELEAIHNKIEYKK